MNQQEPKRLFWYRAKLLGLIAVFLAPFIGGWLALYVFDLRPGSGNYGILVEPVKKLDWPILETLDGQRNEAGFGRKWTFVLFSGESCDELCRSNLFYMRQLRTLLGRDTMRLQNVLISSRPLAEETKIYLRNFPNLKVVENNRNPDLYRQFYLDGYGEVGDLPRMYLVDPDQNLMMHYPAESDHDRVLEDIKKLMKLSQIG
jgi:hypothetical protein